MSLLKMRGQTSLEKRKKIPVTNKVKDEFKEMNLQMEGGLNLIVIQDTQSQQG